MMIILIVLSVLFFAALVFLYKKSRETIWDAANTIHLYASLSEEEAKSHEYRQKQSEIKKLSEMIINCFDTP